MSALQFILDAWERWRYGGATMTARQCRRRLDRGERWTFGSRP